MLLHSWPNPPRQEGLKRILQDFSGIERTTVEYRTWNSSTGDPAGAATTGLMLGSRGVCSDNGTTVTVTFDSVSIEVGRWDRSKGAGSCLHEDTPIRAGFKEPRQQSTIWHQKHKLRKSNSVQCGFGMTEFVLTTILEH